jgi:hypothetical protein
MYTSANIAEVGADSADRIHRYKRQHDCSRRAAKLTPVRHVNAREFIAMATLNCEAATTNLTFMELLCTERDCAIKLKLGGGDAYNRSSD